MNSYHYPTFKTLVFAAAAASILQSAPVQAENVYLPRLVVPCEAGTSADRWARHMATRMYNDWGQQVLVENIPSVAAGARTDGFGRWIADGRTIVFIPGNCADEIAGR